MTAQLTVDFEVQAAYLTLRDGEAVKTCEVAPGVNVDLDDMNVVLGVEVLSLDVTIPFSELTTKYHVHSKDLSALESIRPSVTSFVTRQSAVAFSASGVPVPA